jgi:hypothetical protein
VDLPCLSSFLLHPIQSTPTQSHQSFSCLKLTSLNSLPPGKIKTLSWSDRSVVTWPHSASLPSLLL